MDLSFARLHAAPAPGQVTAMPVELAVLMVGVASRQAASATARVQASLLRARAGDRLLAPRSGSFSAATAAALTAWQYE